MSSPVGRSSSRALRIRDPAALNCTARRSPPTAAMSRTGLAPELYAPSRRRGHQTWTQAHRPRDRPAASGRRSPSVRPRRVKHLRLHRRSSRTLDAQLLGLREYSKGCRGKWPTELRQPNPARQHHLARRPHRPSHFAPPRTPHNERTERRLFVPPTAPERCSYVLSRGRWRRCWQTSDGPLAWRAGSYQAGRCRGRGWGAAGRQIVRRTT